MINSGVRARDEVWDRLLADEEETIDERNKTEESCKRKNNRTRQRLTPTISEAKRSTAGNVLINHRADRRLERIKVISNCGNKNTLNEWRVRFQTTDWERKSKMSISDHYAHHELVTDRSWIFICRLVFSWSQVKKWKPEQRFLFHLLNIEYLAFQYFILHIFVYYANSDLFLHSFKS